jgi:hypothetical protein
VPDGTEPDFSDYIVFADESGDHGMESIDPQFPVFNLVFCVFEKAAYLERIEPEIRRFKFKHFGHDAVVLHEREIRKELRPFDFLKASAERRTSFMDDLTELMRGIEMKWFAMIIDKVKHRAKYSDPWNPYEVAMHFGMEKVCHYLRSQGQAGKAVHVLFEARGKNEDQAIELEFRRVTTNQKQFGWKKVNFTVCGFEPVFVAKAANMAGHQITDLIARPLALRALRPDQPNQAVTAIWPRLGYFKTFP